MYFSFVAQKAFLVPQKQRFNWTVGICTLVKGAFYLQTLDFEKLSRICEFQKLALTSKQVLRL